MTAATSRLRRLAWAMASLVAAVALLAGVPLLLTNAVGWPLPTSIPSIDTLDHAARTGIDDQFVLKTLAVIVWLAWAQFALALAAESLAVARGRQAHQVPVLPGFQATAARLVAGIVMIMSSVQPAYADASPPPIPAATTQDTPDSADSTDHTSALVFNDGPPAPTADRPPAATLEHPTVTVQRHDSYWAIAERTLGDGLRWKEIHDLNVGRTLPDGTTITASDEVLHTGWELLLPADATVDHDPNPSANGPSAVEQHRSTVVAKQGDNLWTISKSHLEHDLGRAPADAEIVPYWRDVIDANQARFVQPGNPDLIHPGQWFVLPPTGENAPAPAQDNPGTKPPPQVDGDPVDPSPPPPDQRSEQPTPATTPASSTTITPPTTTAPPPIAESETADTTGSSVPTAVAVGGLSSVALAVGLKRLLNRRRRRFTNAHPGQLPRRTPPDQRELHQAVVAQADEQRIDDLHGVLGRLAADLAAMSSPRRPRMIRHSTDSLEVIPDKPDTNPPRGWASTDDGTLWTLIDVPDPDDAYDGPLCPAPLMVTIGQPEDDAQLYLDLETDGLLALTGTPEVTRNLARSITTELTLSPLADTLRVIAIGEVVAPDAEALDHLAVVDSWDCIAEDLQAWVSESHEALAENGWANAFVARGEEPDHDALIPIAVVADQPPPDELARVLRDALPSAVGVVVVGSFPDAITAIRCEDDALNFDVVDLACSPQELGADELAAMSRLLVAADSPDEQELIAELQAEYEASNGADASANGNPPATAEHLSLDEPPPYEVLVRLLGDITVEGGEPLKPKGTSVVAYLALHRSVTTENLEDACWFGADGTSHRKRLRDTMTECRDALGSQHFPANRTGTYDAGPLVGTDLDRFEWHVQRAADLDPVEAVAHYRAALDLVSGKPFSYPNAARASYGWVDLEHHATTWELRIAQIAQACAELYLDTDQAANAIAMLHRILQVIPLNSAVVETLMRSHIATDDHAGAKRVYEEHAAALEQGKLGEPEDSIEQLRLELHSR